jgi:hypothetical protein
VTAAYVEGGSNVRVLAPRLPLADGAAQAASFHVQFLPDEASWPADARLAFQQAVDIWAAQVHSAVVIEIEATWEPASQTYVLGSARAYDYWSNFNGAVIRDTWYPYSLANKLSGTDLDPQHPDILASFNSAFPDWYFGLDGNPPANKYDFISVALHEIGHGLGFSGSMFVGSYFCGSSDYGCWGYGSSFPMVYDRFTTSSTGQSLVDPSIYPNKSAALGSQLQGGSLYFSGSRALLAASGEPPRLYAPRIWEPGSSYSHLDEDTYSLSDGNALMTPQLANGEVIHAPGNVALSIMADLGWTVDLAPVQPPAPTPTPIPPSPPPVLSAKVSLFFPLMIH